VGQPTESPWDSVQVAYFSGEALWTYLNAPLFLPRTASSPKNTVDGETWRRLQVSFPDEVKSHCREQFFCYGPDGLLRRHDYTVDILGGATGLNYASDYRDLEGLLFPVKRRVYAYGGDYLRDVSNMCPPSGGLITLVADRTTQLRSGIGTHLVLTPRNRWPSSRCISDSVAWSKVGLVASRRQDKGSVRGQHQATTLGAVKWRIPFRGAIEHSVRRKAQSL
jgi:hypothetical protein